MKGLTVYVKKHKFGASANGGLSERFDELTLVGPAVEGPDEPTADAPAVELVKRVIGGEVVIHAVPVEPVPSGRVGYMYGGAVIDSSDSRFGEALRRLGGSSYCAIKLHDRTESTVK